MFGNILSTMTTAQDTSDAIASRRKHVRRYSDHCICEIDGKAHPVLNWSLGGVQVTADDRLFGTGQDAEIVLKFKIRSSIIEVAHKAQVVRKSAGKIALQFEPLTRKARNQFQNILDDYMANEFANSQI